VLSVQFSSHLYLSCNVFTFFEIYQPCLCFFSWDVPEGRNILHTVNRRKGNWIGHILGGNCLLKHVIEGQIVGRIEVTGRRGRRRKQLLDAIKEKRRWSKLIKEALDGTLCRTRFGRGSGSFVRQTTEWVTGFRATCLSSHSTRHCARFDFELDLRRGALSPLAAFEWSYFQF